VLDVHVCCFILSTLLYLDSVCQYGMVMHGFLPSQVEQERQPEYLKPERTNYVEPYEMSEGSF
jgi:hypothetical protein